MAGIEEGERRRERGRLGKEDPVELVAIGAERRPVDEGARVDQDQRDSHEDRLHPPAPSTTSISVCTHVQRKLHNKERK